MHGELLSLFSYGNRTGKTVPAEKHSHALSQLAPRVRGGGRGRLAHALAHICLLGLVAGRDGTSVFNKL